MTEAQTPIDPNRGFHDVESQLDDQADLQTVLAAWHTATVRLEQTHAMLRDEVCQLTDELEVKNRELARKNRLADLGQMASHVAHEVRNNLVPVTLYLSLLKRRMAGDAEGLAMVEKIQSAFQAMDVMVNDLLHFTSDREPQLQSVSLGKLLSDVQASLAPQFAAQNIQVTLDASALHSVSCDREMVRRAVLNLVLNALDAMPQGGRLLLQSMQTSGGLEIHIADSGPGLSSEIMPRVFEPFFTTKQGGTGLGLAIVSRIAEAHGGTISAGQSLYGGAEFVLDFPVATQDQSMQRAEGIHPSLPTDYCQPPTTSARAA